MVFHSDTWAVLPLWTAALIGRFSMDRCWLRPFKSSWPNCTLRLPSTNMPASIHRHTHRHTHAHKFICCSYRCYIGPLHGPALAAHLCLKLACILSEIVPKSSCRGVSAPQSASSSCAVSAMPLSHGSLYGQLLRSGRSSGGQHRKLKK